MITLTVNTAPYISYFHIDWCVTAGIAAFSFMLCKCWHLFQNKSYYVTVPERKSCRRCWRSEFLQKFLSQKFSHDKQQLRLFAASSMSRNVTFKLSTDDQGLHFFNKVAVIVIGCPKKKTFPCTIYGVCEFGHCLRITVRAAYVCVFRLAMVSFLLDMTCLNQVMSKSDSSFWLLSKIGAKWLLLNETWYSFWQWFKCMLASGRVRSSPPHIGN